MTAFTASQPVLRRTMGGYIEQTWFADGRTREEAYIALNEYIRRANAGKDRFRPTVVKVGKPTIRRAA